MTKNQVKVENLALEDKIFKIKSLDQASGNNYKN